MLILSPEDVSACGVSQPGHTPTLGVAFQGRAFYPESGVHLSEAAAIERCRFLLDVNPRTTTQAIILSEAQGYAIYLSSPDVQTLSIPEVLTAICEQIRATPDLVRDRRWRLRQFKACFIGSEAVTWLVEQLRLSRTEAVALGQQCQDLGLFRHVLAEQAFADAEYFYRFRADGEPEYRIASGAPLAPGEVIFRGIRGSIER